MQTLGHVVTGLNDSMFLLIVVSDSGKWEIPMWCLVIFMCGGRQMSARLLVIVPGNGNGRLGVTVLLTEYLTV
jgi:hypothetical protein